MNSQAHGKIIICMATVFTLGKTVDVMRDTMNMIRNMGMGFINGLMAGDMKETGLTANNTDKESIYYPIAQSKLECGNMEKEVNG